MADFDAHRPVEQELTVDSMMIDLPVPPSVGPAHLTLDVEHAEAHVKWRLSIQLTDAQLPKLAALIDHAIRQKGL